MRSRYLLSTVGLSLALSACGSSPPPAEHAAAPAASAPASESPPAESAAPASSGAAGAGKADKGDKSKEQAGEDTGPKLTRTPTDILTAPDVVFMFSFSSSDISKEAEDKCDKSSGDDAKKRSECLSKARSKVNLDGVRFKKEGGQWWWITFRRKGNVLQMLHKVPFEFGPEKGNTIVLKPTGKDKGPAPMNVPKEVVFEIPNEYQIATKDPNLGRVVYEAKIGIAGD